MERALWEQPESLPIDEVHLQRLRIHPGVREIGGTKKMKHLTLCLLVFAALSAASAKQTFTGIITDSMCEKGDHSQMRMGPTDAECAKACNSDHGASYVLYDGKDAYTLSDQQTAEKFLAKKVNVVGALDVKTKTIRVDSITLAK
jgi:hypothetical protein